MGCGLWCFLLVFVARCAAMYPFQDPSKPWADRVDDLVNRLTLEEIAGQTIADYGKPGTPAIERLGIRPYVWITECMRGQVNANTTAFPHSIGLSSSWSADLLFNISTAISHELRAQWNGLRKQGAYKTFYGLSCFSPMINIARHPLWGRNQEVYGECPHLSGVVAGGFVRGLHGDHPRYMRATGGCKVTDAHSGPENIPVSRLSFDAQVSMRDWRMTYLPALKTCVQAGTYSLMCSYNSINGIPACADKQLLSNITRGEWGFRGYIVSDAGAITNIYQQHNYTSTAVDAVTLAIRAGTNLELGSRNFDNIPKAVKDGNLTEVEIREMVKPLLYTRMRLGEFDPESSNPYNAINMSEVQSQTHRDLAIKAAQMTFTLLKNDDNVLPIKQKVSKMAIVGPMADNIEQLYGDYPSTLVRQFAETPREGLGNLAHTLSYAAGCTGNHSTHCQNYNASSIEEAVSGTDLVVVCLGTGQDVESEGNDRAYLDLPGYQLDLLKDAVLYANGKPVILLLFNAGPLDITWAKLHPGVHAIIACFFPAQSTGQALYNTLTGASADANPAGRLSMTWPANMQQVPDMTNYSMEGRTYRYFKGHPLYPFGYGLSYTTFVYSDLSVTPLQASHSVNITINVNLKNQGTIPSDEVTQVYISWTNNTVPVPKLQLVGFQRNHVEPSRKRELTFSITWDQLAVWIDDKTGWGHLNGKMMVYVGGQQPNQRTDVGSNVLTGSFTVKNQLKG